MPQELDNLGRPKKKFSTGFANALEAAGSTIGPNVLTAGGGSNVVGGFLRGFSAARGGLRKEEQLRVANEAQVADSQLKQSKALLNMAEAGRLDKGPNRMGLIASAMGPQGDGANLPNPNQFGVATFPVKGGGQKASLAIIGPDGVPVQTTAAVLNASTEAHNRKINRELSKFVFDQEFGDLIEQDLMDPDDIAAVRTMLGRMSPIAAAQHGRSIRNAILSQESAAALQARIEPGRVLGAQNVVQMQEFQQKHFGKRISDIPDEFGKELGNVLGRIPGLTDRNILDISRQDLSVLLKRGDIDAEDQREFLRLQERAQFEFENAQNQMQFAGQVKGWAMAATTANTVVMYDKRASNPRGGVGWQMIQHAKNDPQVGHNAEKILDTVNNYALTSGFMKFGGNHALELMMLDPGLKPLAQQMAQQAISDEVVEVDSAMLDQIMEAGIKLGEVKNRRDVIAELRAKGHLVNDSASP